MMEQNLKLAKKYHTLIKNNRYDGSDAFKKHIYEMETFFENVQSHYSELLEEWNKKKL